MRPIFATGRRHAPDMTTCATWRCTYRAHDGLGPRSCARLPHPFSFMTAKRAHAPELSGACARLGSMSDGTPTLIELVEIATDQRGPALDVLRSRQARPTDGPADLATSRWTYCGLDKLDQRRLAAEVSLRRGRARAQNAPCETLHGAFCVSEPVWTGDCG